VVLCMSGRHKVGCSLMCAIKKFMLVFGGKCVLKLLVLVIGFLSLQCWYSTYSKANILLSICKI